MFFIEFPHLAETTFVVIPALYFANNVPVCFTQYSEVLSVDLLCLGFSDVQLNLEFVIN